MVETMPKSSYEAFFITEIEMLFFCLLFLDMSTDHLL